MSTFREYRNNIVNCDNFGYNSFNMKFSYYYFSNTLSHIQDAYVNFNQTFYILHSLHLFPLNNFGKGSV